MPTVTLPSTLSTKAQNLLQTIAEILGVDVSLVQPNFRLTLQGLESGDDVFVSLMPGGGGPTQIERVVPGNKFTVPTTGSADADTASGTTTLVAGTKDVTVPGGVPVGSTVYATVIANAGAIGLISAVRKNATEITISSGNASETSTIRWVVVRP